MNPATALAERDLALLFERRFKRAPIEVREAIGSRLLVSKFWLRDQTLFFYVGSGTNVGAAVKRAKTFHHPFPRLFGRQSSMFVLEGHNAIENLTIDLAGNMNICALSLKVGGTVTLNDVGIRFRDLKNEEYTISFLAAYRAASDDDAALFGPEELDLAVVKAIARMRGKTDAPQH